MFEYLWERKYVKQKCDAVKVRLKAKYGEDIELTAICYDEICSPLPVKVNVHTLGWVRICSQPRI